MRVETHVYFGEMLCGDKCFTIVNSHMDTVRVDALYAQEASGSLDEFLV